MLRNFLSERNLFASRFNNLGSRLFSLNSGNENEEVDHKVKENLKKTRTQEYYLNNKKKLQESHRNYYLKNKEKLKKSSLAYYEKNKEKLQPSLREYYLKNKGKFQESSREYYEKNKDQLLKSIRRYRLKNKEKVNESVRKYSLKNKEKIDEYRRKYYLKNKEKWQEANRDYYLKNEGYHRIYRLKNLEKLLEKYIRKKRVKNINYVFKRSLAFWSDQNSVRKFLDKAAESLYISNPSDWYRISNSQIIKVRGSALFRRFPTLGDALNFAYPEHSWDVAKFRLRGKKSMQRWLLVQMRLLLPNEVIVEDYSHPSLCWDSDRPVQLDIFVHGINLAVEYQGEQHFRELYAFGAGRSLDGIIKRDQEKKDMCEKNGITIVYIPFWWDGTSQSLSSTLYQYFPNVFSSTDSPPIPTSLSCVLQKDENGRESKNIELKKKNRKINVIE